MSLKEQIDYLYKQMQNEGPLEKAKIQVQINTLDYENAVANKKSINARKILLDIATKKYDDLYKILRKKAEDQINYRAKVDYFQKQYDRGEISKNELIRKNCELYKRLRNLIDELDK